MNEQSLWFFTTPRTSDSKWTILVASWCFGCPLPARGRGCGRCSCRSLLDVWKYDHDKMTEHWTIPTLRHKCKPTMVLQNQETPVLSMSPSKLTMIFNVKNLQKFISTALSLGGYNSYNTFIPSNVLVVLFQVQHLLQGRHSFK